MLLNEGYHVRATARLTKATRRSILDWRTRYETHGEEGLVPEEPGRPVEMVSDEFCTTLLELLQKELGDYCLKCKVDGD